MSAAEPLPSGPAAEAPWWRGAVVYQIYPKSFCDSDGDGFGDLEGIRSRLDHLAWLGVDALWLSPIYPSPGVDGGYDVADYCDIEPVFGDLAAFDRLVADAHARGLRVLLDWVPNHTSDQHPWFQSSRREPSGPHGDFYWWADEPANNWPSAFGGPAWTYDEVRGQYYLHLFTPAQPDLNWNEPAVHKAMLDTLRFWLDRGVDGFRADVVHLIGRDPALKDLPPRDNPGPDDLVSGYRDPRTHELLRDVRRLLDSYPGERVMVGEVALASNTEVVAYLGSAEQPELHMAFDFSLVDSPCDAEIWRQRIAAAEDAHSAAGTIPAWVLSSHDASRHRSRHGGSEAAARAAAVVLLTLRGTPFLFAGEEFGLQDAVVSPEEAHDPLGRDRSRAPIPWTAAAPHGWVGDRPWLPWPPEPDRHNREALVADRSSILWLYRQLLQLRKSLPEQIDGALELLDSPAGTVAYRRTRAGSAVGSAGSSAGGGITVVANLLDSPTRVGCVGAVLLDSARPGTAGVSMDAAGQLTLPPRTAVVLREH